MLICQNDPSFKKRAASLSLSPEWPHGLCMANRWTRSSPKSPPGTVSAALVRPSLRSQKHQSQQGELTSVARAAGSGTFFRMGAGVFRSTGGVIKNAKTTNQVRNLEVLPPPPMDCIVKSIDPCFYDVYQGSEDHTGASRMAFH